MVVKLLAEVRGVDAWYENSIITITNVCFAVLNPISVKYNGAFIRDYTVQMKRSLPNFI